MPPAESTLYFHAQCFDGIASAVISRAYLVEQLDWPEPNLLPIGYDRQKDWLRTPLARCTAVVDFLFHPEARFWADHHETAFVASPPGAMQRDWFYDSAADSCAGLLVRALTPAAPFLARFSELAAWAERTDAARYESPEEAVFSRKPAFVVNGALIGSSGEDCIELINFLSQSSLDEAAALPWVRARATLLEKKIEAGLKVLKGALRVRGGVASFVVDAPGDAVVHRYAPYLMAPEARYSAGLVRMADRVRLSVMRNPWIEFESLHLGRLCARFGGGGHQRVGAASFPLDKMEEALQALREIELAMQQQVATKGCYDRAV